MNDRKHTLSQYVGPTDVVRKRGRTYVYDSGSGEIIAELTDEAADAFRDHQAATLTYDGGRNVAKAT